MAGRAFCARRSEALQESAAGTASTVRAFLLLEHGGPWGHTALRDAAFPDRTGAVVQARCAAAGVRPMLMRRPGARPGLLTRPTVVLAACSPAGGTAASRVLDDVRDAADLPLPDLLAGLRDGRIPTGWSDVPHLWGACTHGRHDACCAERGRPVAAALAEAAGDTAWEVSHMGGDRFAGNVIRLPEGLYYGRVPPGRAGELVAAHRGGRVVPDLLRGRTSLPFPVQAAEVQLRRYLSADGAGEVALASSSSRGGRTVTTWDVAGRGTWRVVVDTTHPGPLRPLTCTSEAAAPPVHTVVELTDVAAPGRGAQGWDDVYAGAGAADGGGPGAGPDDEPSPTVTGAVSDVPGGQALDVAAGTGRHAAWLARHGWRVTALDFSAVGVAAGSASTASAGLDVQWVLGDARVWEPPPGHPGYDLVLMAYVHAPEVARRAAAWLAPGGRLVVVGHARRNVAEGSGGPRDPALTHTLEGLRGSAAGLEVERLEEVVRPRGDGSVVEAVLVARGPASTTSRARPTPPG